MTGLRFLGRTAPRHPGGGSGSASTTPSHGAGRGSAARGAPIFRTLLGGTEKHVAVIGSTGCGKTSLAKLLCAVAPRPVVIDWDGEYTDLGLPIHEPPFMLPAVDIATLLSNLERPPDGGHGIAFATRMARVAATTLEELARELERLAFGYGLVASWAQAALARLVILKEYCLFTHHPYERGIFNLSGIPQRERAVVQQALATALLLAREPNPPGDPLLLVIEEGAMGSTQHYLKDLLILSRRRKVQLLFISQVLPAEELLPSFILLIGDPGPMRERWSRQLGLPLPHLRRGEFLAYDGNTIRKIRVKL